MNWRALSRLDAQRTSCKALWPHQLKASRNSRAGGRRRAVAGPQVAQRFRDRKWRSFLSRAGHLKNHSPHPSPLIPDRVLSNLCWNQPKPSNKWQKKKKQQKKNELKTKKQKTAMGSSTSFPPGGAFATASPRDSTYKTPNTSTFRLKICCFYRSRSHDQMRAVKWAAGDWIT